jgi:adenine-specific DNA-methyltransferase
MNLHSTDLTQQKLDELKNIFPEIFEDGRINYDKFKTILGENVDDKNEHYSFNWSGKKECYRTIKAKTNATLKVDTDENIPDGDNVFIEGDNLEVLKLLQNSYHKKVKMIYIDPPYNKDKDFVYRDTWGDSIKNYLIQTGQMNEEGFTTTKTQSSGRRHTNWLNMIYPRLWLSRNLLKDDGVIFVSIDDDEVANLRKVMDEIYGEENFVACSVWQKKYGPANDAKWVSATHEYILIYAKNIESWKPGLLARNETQLSAFINPDDDKRGLWRASDLSVRTYNKKCDYKIIAPNGSVYSPPASRAWAINETRFEELLKDNRITFGKDGNGRPMFKKFLSEVKEGITPETWWSRDKAGDNKIARYEIKDIFPENIFETPKPSKLLNLILNIANTKNEDIILDFFAGSGTTAHAVMDLNAEDGGNRKYILVQLPEATDEKSEAYKAGYKKISDITKERIKRVIKKLEYKDGFKSYYLDNSNFAKFAELKKRPNDTLEEIEKLLKMSVFVENILTSNAKELDVVYEIGLKNGFTLSAKTENFESGVYKFVKLYEEERVFYFCFNKKIQNDIVQTLPQDAKLICYENALDDSVKLNLHTNLNLETL